MVGIVLDASRLHADDPKTIKELVAYLNELRAGDPEKDGAICLSLLEAFEQGIASDNVLGIFSSWSKSPVVVAKCLNYRANAAVRRKAIKEFGKYLRYPGKFDWESTWNVLGGREGMVQIFSRSSVTEVKTMCIHIGCSNFGKPDEKRERCVEELLRTLLPTVYPAPSPGQSRDKRPLQHHYAKMLPACSGSFVEKVLDSRDESNPLFRWRDFTRLLRSHRILLRARAINHLFSRVPRDADVSRYVQHFLDTDKDFAIETLRGRLDGSVSDESWGSSEELHVLMPILKRLAKHWLAPIEKHRRIHGLMKLGVEILRSRQTRTTAASKGLWDLTFARWQRRPEQYEDVFRLALQSGMAKLPHRDLASYLPVLRRLQPVLRGRLLQLCYLDIPETGLDIFSAEDYSMFAKQTWPLDLFRMLNGDQQVRLLKKLYQANPEFSFLQGTSENSVISDRDVGSQRNFNVDLYLTILERDQGGVQATAKAAIDRLRRQASVAREQSDRAAFAKAAASYAIATGDLDVYGETMVWQQRFVRDPLTVKVVFNRTAVLTDEGVELLSGIGTLDTLSQAVKNSIPLLLVEMTRDIDKADAILRTLQESYLLAKREPSFQEYDWAHVKSLFTAAMDSRIYRADVLQRDLAIPGSKLFQVLWTGLSRSFDWLDIEFLNAVQNPIQSLLSRSQPGFLAYATTSLLQLGSQRREQRKGEKKQGSPPADEALEQISYRALMALANSDVPALASPLILQTILERPDASSWHRMLLSIGFLKRLQADEAHDLLLDLAKGIGEKLEEQSYVRVGDSQPPKHVSLQPTVKVTTVKYLAQLLNDAEFISDDAAVEILVELFKAAQHRDIRLAALDSLLSLLDSLARGTQQEIRANPAVHRILTALRTVVPVAGSINERRPIQTNDWLEAETTGILPELSDFGPDGLPPLMSAVVTAVSNSSRAGLKKLEAEFVKHIIIPMIDQSRKEHTRWVEMFLTKHNATSLMADLPETPITARVWTVVLSSFYTHLPTEYLLGFERYALHRIAPATTIKDFNTSLRKDLDLRKNPEVQHWLRIFDGHPSMLADSETNTLFLLLDSVHTQLKDHGALLDMIVQHTELYLDQYEKYMALWETLVNNLSPSPRIIGDEKEYSKWYSGRRHIASHIVTLVKEKRRSGG
ncbi:Hypothetical protein D9617_1g085210 [Elsinoe fawcettii]|nr:Hypothetical protein D9617_1g085210 [Elsinoe fawcettii]